MAMSVALKSVESMTLRVPVTPVPTAAVGDSAASDVLVCRLQFEEPGVVRRVRDLHGDRDAGAGVDDRRLRRRETGLGDGLELVVGEDPGDGIGERRPVGRGALHHVDLPY